MNTIAFRWLPLAVVITSLITVLFLVMHQQLQMVAYDPQIELANDMANRLARGADPRTIQTQPPINIATSISTFALIFNEKKEAVAATGMLDNKLPEVPDGVFEQAENRGEYRLSWEPQGGVKIATVVVHFSGQNTGYVIIGRSLRETEKRSIELLTLSLIGWLVSMVSSLAMVFFLNWWAKKSVKITSSQMPEKRLKPLSGGNSSVTGVMKKSK